MPARSALLFPSPPQKPHKIPRVVSRRDYRNAEFPLDVFDREIVQEKVIVSHHALGRDDHKIAVHPALQRIDEIAARQEARNTDSSAPETALDGDDLQIHSKLLHT